MKTIKKGNNIFVELEASQFEWELAPGKIIEAWGFNNQIPGPMIRAKQGDTLTIKVKNNLPEPTIVHWHGIRLPAAMDGTDGVQKPIEPREEFTYHFELPDAGTFWYHSHHNETVQMERGMYGSLIVEETSELVVDNEQVFVLDDMKLKENNAFSKPGWFLPRIMERHDGREGDTLLVNGKETPLININAGQTERWRFINASSARYVQLYLGGKTFKLIGTDGGLIEKPVEMDRILLTPGERAEILVGPFTEGEEFKIESLPYNRMTSKKPKRVTFATVKVGVAKDAEVSIPEILRKIESLAPQDAEINRHIKFSVGPSLKNGMNFLVNDDIHINDKPVNRNELQVWEVYNSSLMDHPFHLHGFFFQVLEENGKAPEYISWKDTYNLKPRTKVKIAWMPDDRPGVWMYHCHILEHHEAGMMANFEVLDENHPEPKLVGHHHHQ